MKTCKKCGETKGLTEFKWMTGPGCGNGYYRGSCNKCEREYSRTHSSNLKHQTPEAQRKRYLKATYGITAEDYEVLLERQEGKCAICGTTKPVERKHLSVDHCHETGKIRGLLCQPCNKGLGHFRDDVAILQQAAEYLKKH